MGPLSRRARRATAPEIGRESRQGVSFVLIEESNPFDLAPAGQQTPEHPAAQAGV